MLCQKCGAKQATVHFVKVINGQRTEMHLCEKCAPAAKQDFPEVNSFDTAMSDIINSFFGGIAAMPVLKCDSCGTGFNLFSQTGKLGCSDCYGAFAAQLTEPLRRIHGSARHTGKIPKRAGGGVDRVSELKRRLQEAIASENYEEAARLRDEVRMLEGGGGK